MRASAIVVGAAALALSACAAQAQARPGQYGGGFVEYLLTGGGMAARPGPVQPAPRGGVPPAGRIAGYGPAVYGDPASVYPRHSTPARHAALQGNPYETIDPIARMQEPDDRPEPRSARPASYDPGAAAIARAPDPRFGRQVVPYEGRQKPGTIVVDTGSRYLYLVQPGGQAIRYGIGVGRPGFLWHGTKTISAKKEWPDWTPPPEMMQRRPDLPTHMVGGPENPLGARALYLGSSLYRIHGTNEPHTIGQAVSSGCIRMMNEDVVDLYERTPVGTRVEVI